jgi:hypothetical protein
MSPKGEHAFDYYVFPWRGDTGGWYDIKDAIRGFNRKSDGEKFADKLMREQPTEHGYVVGPLT